MGVRCKLRAPTRCELATACHGSCGELSVQARERSARGGLFQKGGPLSPRWPLGTSTRALLLGSSRLSSGQREREHARCTGELCLVLVQLICDMGRVWNTDVQEIEGCNSTIQHISKLAPSMSWMLLSARVITKKLIALLPTRAAKSEFLAECVLRHQGCNDCVQRERLMDTTCTSVLRRGCGCAWLAPDLPIARAWVTLRDCLRALVPTRRLIWMHRGRCCSAAGIGCQCCISILKPGQRVWRLRVAKAPWETPCCTLP